MPEQLPLEIKPVAPHTKVWSTQVCRVLDQLKLGKKCWCNAQGASRYPHTAACIDAAGLYRQAGGKQ